MHIKILLDLSFYSDLEFKNMSITGYKYTLFCKADTAFLHAAEIAIYPRLRNEPFDGYH